MTGLQHLRYDSVKPESSQIGSPNTTNGLVILLLIKHSDFFKLQILQTKNLERGCTWSLFLICILQHILPLPPCKCRLAPNKLTAPGTGTKICNVQWLSKWWYVRPGHFLCTSLRQLPGALRVIQNTKNHSEMLRLCVCRTTEKNMFKINIELDYLWH